MSGRQVWQAPPSVWKRYGAEPMTWTHLATMLALARGWSIFHSDMRGLEIERDDEAAIYTDDNAALLAVQAAAIQDDALSVRALVYLDQQSGRKGGGRPGAVATLAQAATTDSATGGGR